MAMDYRRQDNGLVTFLEHWGWFFTVLFCLGVSQMGMFFVNLQAERWIYFFAEPSHKENNLTVLRQFSEQMRD